jgi:hypothetical protein
MFTTTTTEINRKDRIEYQIPGHRAVTIQPRVPYMGAEIETLWIIYLSVWKPETGTWYGIRYKEFRTIDRANEAANKAYEWANKGV